MDEQEKRKKRCCFTGHRPEKLGVPSQVVKAGLERAIDEAIRDGYRTFISGMSRGTDIWAAQIVLDRKRTLPDIHLIINIAKKQGDYSLKRACCVLRCVTITRSAEITIDRISSDFIWISEPFTNTLSPGCRFSAAHFAALFQVYTTKLSMVI